MWILISLHRLNGCIGIGEEQLQHIGNVEILSAMESALRIAESIVSGGLRENWRTQWTSGRDSPIVFVCIEEIGDEQIMSAIRVGHNSTVITFRTGRKRLQILHAFAKRLSSSCIHITIIHDAMLVVHVSTHAAIRSRIARINLGGIDGIVVGTVAKCHCVRTVFLRHNTHLIVDIHPIRCPCGIGRAIRLSRSLSGVECTLLLRKWVN